jgi:hypothetical protein
MFNRTHLERGTMRLDPKKYTTPPHVRFNKEKEAQGSSFNPKYFDCNPKATSGAGQNEFSTALLTSILVVILGFRGICE